MKLPSYLRFPIIGLLNRNIAAPIRKLFTKGNTETITKENWMEFRNKIRYSNPPGVEVNEKWDSSEWKEETINFLAEIGLEDYYFITNSSWRIRSIDPDKIKPIARQLSLNEQIIVKGIYELRGFKVPYAESFLT